VLEDNGVGVDREADLTKFLDLARTEERRGIGRVTSLEDSRDHVGTGRVDEECQFVELVIELVLGDARELHSDEDDLLADRAIDERSGYIGHASSHSTFATNCTGPLNVAAAPFSVTCSAPPGLSTVTSCHTSRRGARPRPPRTYRSRRPWSSRRRARSLDREVILAFDGQEFDVDAVEVEGEFFGEF